MTDLDDALDAWETRPERDIGVDDKAMVLIVDAARKWAYPDYEAAAREYVRLRFGDTGFTKEEAFDASLIVAVALGIANTEDTG